MIFLMMCENEFDFFRAFIICSLKTLKTIE